MLPSYCNQHHVGRAAPDVTTRLNLLTRVWALTKTLAYGDARMQLLKNVTSVLASEEGGLAVVVPATFVLQPGDLGEEFTQSFLARCREDKSAAEETALGQTADDTREFARFFPCGWNRHRPVHLCPPGGCGPSACHDRGGGLIGEGR